MEQKNQEIIRKCDQMVKAFESQIDKCENDIQNILENKGSVKKLSKLIEKIKNILREVKYKYDSLVNEYELYNNVSLLDEIQKNTNILSFIKNVEIAPRDTKTIEEINSYFSHNIRYSSVDLVLLDGNELREIQNLSPQGRLKQNWRKSHEELKSLFAKLEELKKFPEIIRYFDSH